MTRITRIEIRPHRRRWLAAGVVAAITCFAVSAYAFGGRHHRGHGDEFREFMLNKMLDRADASDEQRAKITEIMRRAHEDVAELREGGHEAFHARMLELLTAEKVDAEAIDALRAEHQQQIAQALDRMSDALVEAANVLSQEQRVAIAEAIRERAESHHGHGPHGPPFF